MPIGSALTDRSYFLEEVFPAGPADGDVPVGNADDIVADGADLIQHDDEGFVDAGEFSGGEFFFDGFEA